MKTKLLRDRKAGALTLQVTPGKHEALEYEQAEWLRASAGDRFCRFEYRRDGGLVLYYDLTGLVELRAHLRAAISSFQYQLLLSSLADVMGACTRQGYPTASLVCDPSLVYVDDSGAPRFVYVPLSGMAERAENTPLALLRHLASTRNVTFAVTGDEAHAAALDDFASRNLVLSLSAYRSFLSEEFGLALGGSGSLGAAVRSAHPGASGQLAAASGALAGAPSRPLGSPGAARVSTGGASPVGGPASPVAFDFVAMLGQAPSATQVRASQSVARQVRDAVGGHSPTAAPAQVAGTVPSVVPATAIPAPCPAGPAAAGPEGPAGQGVSEPAADGASRRCAECGVPLASGSVFCSECGTPVHAPAPELAPAAPALDPTAVQAPPAPQPAVRPAGGTMGRATPTPAPGQPSGGTTLLGSFSATAAAAAHAPAPMPRQAWLVRDSDGLRLRLPDDDRAVVVGRSATCDLQFSGNGNVSRRHVELRRANGGFEVSDLGSANGTFVGGRRLGAGERILLAPGEPLLLADEPLRVVEA